MRLIDIIFVFFVSSNFLSCNGQVKTEHKQAEIKAPAFGKVVPELDNQIWKIFQDVKGNYWFGTNGSGVYKYDGEVLMQFSTFDGLVNNRIRGIQADNSGNLYFETVNGISKYDGLTFTTLKAIKSPNNEWKLAPNDLWFGYGANDLYRFDGQSLYELALPRKDLNVAFKVETDSVSRARNSIDPYSVFGVNKDKDGNIWFGTESAGAYRYDGKAFLWFGEKELSTLPDGRVPGVRAMIQDKDGYFWLSNFYSKYKINPYVPKGYEKMKAVDVPSEFDKGKLRYFNSGIADTMGNLWMTTYDGGVWKYDEKKLSNFEIKNGTENVLLNTIYQDNAGTIWLGTSNDGVYKYNGNNFQKFKLAVKKTTANNDYNLWPGKQ